MGENNGAISPKSVHFVVLSLLAGPDRQAAVWGGGTCDIWGHIYYLIYYLKAGTGALFQPD